MSSWNSAPAYTGASLDSLRESIGIPQFSGAAGDEWAFVFNGLIFQGGKVSVAAGSTVVNLQAPFPQQLLGVFLQPTASPAAYVSAATLSTFTITHGGSTHDVYWWALGV